MPFVYMLRCRDASLYTGAARDIVARVRKHEAGSASRYTRSRRPVVLVWWRRVRTWSQALREEHRIKRLKRPAKQALVNAWSGLDPATPAGGGFATVEQLTAPGAGR